jgi:branched-chain amino acid aminotransferase
MKIYLDGRFVDEKAAKISVFDHGLLYGDGVFEGIRVYGGKIFRLPEHLNRLFASAHVLRLPVPLTREKLTQACVDSCRINKIRDGYIRLVVTRGVGTLGLNPFTCKKPSLFIIAATIQLYPEELYRKGLTLVTVPTVRTLSTSVSPCVKSLNYLNNIMAKIECLDAGADEGVMLNAQGNVAECTGDNIYIVHQRAIFTPPTSAGALNGITRAVIFELASQAGLSLQEKELTRYDLFTAQECFLTGTAAEIIPAVKIDGRRIGTGKPGAVTLDLIHRFRKLTRVEGTPIFN